MTDAGVRTRKKRHACPPTDKCAVAKAERRIVRAVLYEYGRDTTWPHLLSVGLRAAVQSLLAARRRAKVGAK